MPTSKATAAKPAETPEPVTAAMVLPIAVGKVVTQAWMDFGTEAIRFVWDRLQQDMKTQQALLACKSLEEFQAIQNEFFRSAQEQYAAEAGKLLDTLGKATSSVLAASAKARRYDDVPL
jgi:hypothetical protein